MKATTYLPTALRARTILLHTLLLAAIATAQLRAQGLPPGDSTGVTMRPLGSVINTSGFEYGPAISTDGRTLYFVSDRPNGVGMHDLWYATRSDIEGIDFGQPVNLGSAINADTHDGNAWISADGRLFYFTGCHRLDGIGDCDLYVARLEGGVWTDVRNLSELNSAAWESMPSVTPDGETIYFASIRSESIGGSEDIYVARKGEDGIWSTPENLGTPVNMAGRQNAPMILPGGNVLLFTSSDHGTTGSLDFYWTVRQRDGSWREPESLGAPFNSGSDDRSIMLQSTGDQFFIASARRDLQNAGSLDIFSATLPAGSVLLVVRGRVFESGSDNGVRASLTIEDAASGRELATTTTDPATGEYAVMTIAPIGSTIRINGASQTHGTFKGEAQMPGTRQYTELEENIPLGPLSVERSEEAPDGAAAALHLFPNPASRSVTIDCSSLPPAAGEREATVADAYGNEVTRMRFRGDRCTIDLRELPTGVYVARVAGRGKAFVVRK